jgi:hypothetical protein
MSLLDVPNLVTNLVLMTRASIEVYTKDLSARRAALEAMGFVWRGVVQVPGRDVTVVRWGDKNLSITQGTCFTQDNDPREVLADLELFPWRSPWGTVLPHGFGAVLPDIVPKIHALGDPSLPWHHTGHSLGGQTAQLIIDPALLPGTAWAINPPTGASNEHWRRVHSDPRNTNIVLVNEREFAHGYGVGLDWHQDIPFLWLHHGELRESTGRNGFNWNTEEHFAQPTLVNLMTVPGAVSVIPQTSHIAGVTT